MDRAERRRRARLLEKMGKRVANPLEPVSDERATNYYRSFFNPIECVSDKPGMWLFYFCGKYHYIDQHLHKAVAKAQLRKRYADVEPPNPETTVLLQSADTDIHLTKK